MMAKYYQDMSTGKITSEYNSNCESLSLRRLRLIITPQQATIKNRDIWKKKNDEIYGNKRD